MTSRLLTLMFAAVLSLTMMEKAVADEILTITLKTGDVKIKLLADVAPNHVERITTLANAGQYDGVAFHRVIPGFMAQTGDVQHGKGDDMARAGTGGSDLGNLKQEFSSVPFERGTVGMARAQSPDSANSQFFIMFEEGSFLNGQYTVFGQVTSGMEHVDSIKMGSRAANGAIDGEPDRMIKVSVASE